MADDKKSVLLLGATGMLGSYLAKVLPRHFTTLAPCPRVPGAMPIYVGVQWLAMPLEATQSTGLLDKLIDVSRPNIIVNCVAITPRSSRAGDDIDCIAINSLFPHRLAQVARKYGCYLMHVSTDGVFSGLKGNYKETDLPDPPDLYGRSKLLGEVTGNNCLTIRTSFFGLNSGRQGLVEWLLQQQGKSIKGFTRSIFSGLSASTLAHLVADVIAREIPLTGLYHVGGYPISKYDLLVTLARKLEVDVAIEPVDIPVLDRSLCSDRFWEAMQLPVPTLQDMVDDLKRQLDERLNRTCDG